MSLQKFLFNTGVRPDMNPYRADYTEVWGTICLAFHVEHVPAGSVFECICERPDLKYDTMCNRINNVNKILNNGK